MPLVPLRYLRGRDGFSIFERIPTLVLDCGDDSADGVSSSSSSSSSGGGTIITSSGSGIVTEATQEAKWNERFARHAVMVECFFSFLRQRQRVRCFRYRGFRVSRFARAACVCVGTTPAAAAATTTTPTTIT